MSRKTLLDETLDLLANREQTLQEISNETNLGYDWLVSMSQRRIKEPSVNRVEILHDYLVSARATRPKLQPESGGNGKASNTA